MHALVSRRRCGINQILRDNVRVWYDWSYMVAWCGVGLSLLSAILFSSAAICLRGEREREEALNMQYLMPGKRLPHSFSSPSQAYVDFLRKYIRMDRNTFQDAHNINSVVHKEISNSVFLISGCMLFNYL